MRKIIVVSQPYTFVTGLRKYFRNQVIESVVSLRISPPSTDKPLIFITYVV